MNMKQEILSGLHQLGTRVTKIEQAQRDLHKLMKEMRRNMDQSTSNLFEVERTKYAVG